MREETSDLSVVFSMCLVLGLISILTTVRQDGTVTFQFKEEKGSSEKLNNLPRVTLGVTITQI